VIIADIVVDEFCNLSRVNEGQIRIDQDKLQFKTHTLTKAGSCGGLPLGLGLDDDGTDSEDIMIEIV